jgi:uncharacterized membrane protein YtjA (UPF0391 family)
MTVMRVPEWLSCRMLPSGSRFSKPQYCHGMPRQGGARRGSRNQFQGRKLDHRFWTAPPHPARVVEESAMTILKWALIFFLVSVVAGILGFTGISAASAHVARFLFYIFVVIFLVLLILGLTIFRV